MHSSTSFLVFCLLVCSLTAVDGRKLPTVVRSDNPKDFERQLVTLEGQLNALNVEIEKLRDVQRSGGKLNEDEIKQLEELSKDKEKAIEERVDAREKLAEAIGKGIEDELKKVEEFEKDGATFSPKPAGKQCTDLSPGKLLVRAARGGVGSCEVQIFDGDHPLCWLYVKTGTKDIFGDGGFPKQALPDGTLSGSGCVFSKDGPKPQGACIYRNGRFGLDDDEEWRVCQPSGLSNAYFQLSFALERGLCGTKSC